MRNNFQKVSTRNAGSRFRGAIVASTVAVMTVLGTLGGAGASASPMAGTVGVDQAPAGGAGYYECSDTVLTKDGGGPVTVQVTAYEDGLDSGGEQMQVQLVDLTTGQSQWSGWFGVPTSGDVTVSPYVADGDQFQLCATFGADSSTDGWWDGWLYY